MELSKAEKLQIEEVVEAVYDNVCMFPGDGDYPEGDVYCEGWNFASGASKLVAIPEDSNCDFVIKIPFEGHSSERKICECPMHEKAVALEKVKCPYKVKYTLTAAEKRTNIDCLKCQHRFLCLDDDLIQDEDSCYHIEGYEVCDGCHDYEAVTDYDLWNPLPYGCKNYCELEYQYYLRAKEEGLEAAFAEIMPYKTESGMTVYLQVKADTSVLAIQVSPVSKQTFDSCSTDAPFSSPIAIAIIEAYGVEMLVKIINFIENEGINDISCNNVLAKNNKVLFTDYCGYYDF